MLGYRESEMRENTVEPYPYMVLSSRVNTPAMEGEGEQGPPVRGDSYIHSTVTVVQSQQCHAVQ